MTYEAGHGDDCKEREMYTSDLEVANDALRERNEDLEYELAARPLLEPQTCRRCGERKFVRPNGFCSTGCELGYKPGEWWR